MKAEELKRWANDLPEGGEVKFHLVTSRFVTLVLEQGDDIQQSGWIEKRKPPEEEGDK